ncbi:MAG: sulfite exporter TauE/SafE family protein [Polyangiales bacterium]
MLALAPGLALALALALLIGVSLGVLGGGGAILALPVLVYVAGVEDAAAVAMSLAIVGASSLLGALLQLRAGTLHRQAFVSFALTGTPSAYVGAYLTHFVPAPWLLPLFALLMLAAGSAMLRPERPKAARPQCRPLRCTLIGAIVGLITGFLGAGGGFVIVPALVLFAGLEARQAVGTSLAIIAINAVGGLIGQVAQAHVDWSLTAAFVCAALIGMFVGLRLAPHVPGALLKKAFGVFILVVATGIITLRLLA